MISTVSKNWCPASAFVHGRITDALLGLCNRYQIKHLWSYDEPESVPDGIIFHRAARTRNDSGYMLFDGTVECSAHDKPWQKACVHYPFIVRDGAIEMPKNVYVDAGETDAYLLEGDSVFVSYKTNTPAQEVVRFIEELRLERPVRYLECATYTGATFREFSRILPYGSELIATDFSDLVFALPGNNIIRLPYAESDGYERVLADFFHNNGDVDIVFYDADHDRTRGGILRLLFAHSKLLIVHDCQYETVRNLCARDLGGKIPAYTLTHKRRCTQVYENLGTCV